MEKIARLTPMLRHYLEVKAEHPDTLLLYRMGDFYELFFDDAVTAAPILEVALTARQKGSDSEAPMCGVPHHALDSYVGKLLKAGLKVAICDQMEDPAQAKGLVRREVTRVMTPGTVSEPALLDGKQANLLAALSWAGEAGAAAWLDVSTGELAVERFDAVGPALDGLARPGLKELLLDGETPEEIARWAAAEVASVTRVEEDSWFDRGRASETLRRQLDVATLRGFGLDGNEPAVVAAAAVVAYGRHTQRSELEHVKGLSLRQSTDALVLDAATLRNLEIFRPAQGDGSGPTLLSTLDRTVTAQGGRRLRDWLRAPLTDAQSIDGRLDAVAALHDDADTRRELRRLLAGAGDPERLAGRAVLGSLTPREAVALREGLDRAPELFARLREMPVARFDVVTPDGLELFARLREMPAAVLRSLAETDPLADLAGELHRVLAEDPPVRLGTGGVIAEGVDAELDQARSLARDSKQHILNLQSEERKKTGISSLKIRFNKVFNYYIEVSRTNLHLVPERFQRKQTLANAERFITPELKELEERILSAEERQLALEERHFEALRERVAAEAVRLGELGRALATLDVLATFAEVAADRGYVRPRVRPAGAPLVVHRGRHPVVEHSVAEGFVPNDCELDGETGQIVLLTGPNMGGKSTYLRQVALIVVLAQSGCFVPAESAEIGVVDRLFTRVGASDNLARGESTFMVEMIETAHILHAATEHSLVILDEVGRGTATFDGLSLAWAIVEHLHEHGRPKTLFATHYHELTDLAGLLPRVVNRTMAVKEWQDRIVFLRQVVPGSADKSYGLHVARLAGLPEAVIERAGEVLANLEATEFDATGRPRLAKGHVPEGASPEQMALFTPPEQLVAQIVREVDLDELTPLAALNLLASLKSRLGG